MVRFVVASSFLLSLLAAGCAPTIGDSCGSATNCSVNGDRQCDQTQPSGACIVFDCQPDGCPDDAVCVRFNPEEARLRVIGCMRRCGSDENCRDGYHCTSAEEMGLNGMGQPYALVIDADPPDGRFCVAD